MWFKSLRRDWYYVNNQRSIEELRDNILYNDWIYMLCFRLMSLEFSQFGDDVRKHKINYQNHHCWYKINPFVDQIYSILLIFNIFKGLTKFANFEQSHKWEAKHHKEYQKRNKNWFFSIYFSLFSMFFFLILEYL